MTVNAFTYVTLNTLILDAADHLLTKGAAHAAATAVSESEMLGWRLIGDMHPHQLPVHGGLQLRPPVPARFAGLELPKDVGADLTSPATTPRWRTRKPTSPR